MEPQLRKRYADYLAALLHWSFRTNPLQADVSLRNEDIGFIEVGAPVKIKVEIMERSILSFYNRKVNDDSSLSINQSGRSELLNPGPLLCDCELRASNYRT
jgi:hypothetical protein